LLAEAVMAQVAAHLSITELEERFRTAKDPILARHAQVIWLLAQGHTTAQVSAVTSFGPRWIAQLLARYNAEGAPALGDLRQRNGRAASVLKPDLLERLRVRLADPPPDGGLWTSRKVGQWLAGELGLETVSAQRGWEALRRIGWSIQKPRPRHVKAATPEQEAEFKKNSMRSWPKRPRAAPTSRSRCSPPTSTASA
jgi:transposase